MWRILVPVAAFVVAAAAMLPLRVAWAAAPAPQGLSVSSLEGTVWSGRATGVSWNGVALGDFTTSVGVLDLLPSPRVGLMNGSGPLKSAAVRATGGAVSITSADIRLPLSSLDARLPTTTMLRVIEGGIDLDGRTCLRASGRVSVDAAPQLGLPALSGELACQSGDIIASVSTPTGGRAVIAIPLDPDQQPESLEATPDLALALEMLGIPFSGGEPT